MQIMVKRAGACNYLSLSREEIKSISKAEAVAILFLKELGIKSFNEILINLPFEENSTYFRLIICFLTREVDIAVSELNQLFVVDKHPEDTVSILGPIKEMVLQSVEDAAARIAGFHK